MGSALADVLVVDAAGTVVLDGFLRVGALPSGEFVVLSSDGFDGEPGEHGLLVDDSSVLLFDCTLRGGEGGEAQWGFGHGSVVGGAGGDGLRLVGAGTIATHEGLVLVAGMGAQSPNQSSTSPGATEST